MSVDPYLLGRNGRGWAEHAEFRRGARRVEPPGEARSKPGTSARGTEVVAEREELEDVAAEVEFTGDTQGVIVSQGSRFGGYALYVKGGKLIWVYNFLGIPPEQRLEADAPQAGTHIVGVEFAKGLSQSALALFPLLRGLQILLSNALLGSGYQRLVARTQILTAGLNMAANVPLIPLLGWRGAAIATYVSELTNVGLLWRIATRRRHEPVFTGSPSVGARAPPG